MWYFIYNYIIYYHPAYWLLHQAMRYTPGDMDNAFWPVLAIFGIPVYFLATRYFAEVIGRSVGNMYFWWLFFFIFYIWGIPFYWLYYLIAGSTRRHWQEERQKKFGDRPKKARWADAIENLKPEDKGRRRRRR